METDVAEGKELKGLGGWLSLVGLGIILSPLFIIVQAVPVYWQIISNGTWAALTTPGGDAYNRLWAPILYGEVIANYTFIFAWIVLAVLFFLKKRMFPACYICLRLLTVTFILVDAFAMMLVQPDRPLLDAQTAKSLMQTGVATMIWVPYMLVSKRVKATFVK